VAEIDFREEEFDNLIRRSMTAPVPSLPSDFEQRVMRKVRQRSAPLDRYHQNLLILYGLVSVIVSVVAMRGQGLGWVPVAGMILAPLTLLAAAHLAWPASQTMRQSAR
jgi:hypothetical protein